MSGGEQLRRPVRELPPEIARKIEREAQILEGANPKAILARGYAFVRDYSTKHIIRSGSDVRAGDTIEIIPAEGLITASVTKIEG
jgi:exodeoxyribonuclease VII large subunit